jgi:hypothetical protein
MHPVEFRRPMGDAAVVGVVVPFIIQHTWVAAHVRS